MSRRPARPLCNPRHGRSAHPRHPAVVEGDVTTNSFRLRPIMKQGTAAGLPETWIHYASVADARAGAKLMYQNDRVLRVMAVIDSVGSFVEWIER